MKPLTPAAKTGSVLRRWCLLCVALFVGLTLGFLAIGYSGGTVHGASGFASTGWAFWDEETRTWLVRPDSALIYDPTVRGGDWEVEVPVLVDHRVTKRGWRLGMRSSRGEWAIDVWDQGRGLAALPDTDQLKERVAASHLMQVIPPAASQTTDTGLKTRRDMTSLGMSWRHSEFVADYGAIRRAVTVSLVSALVAVLGVSACVLALSIVWPRLKHASLNA